MDGEKPVIKKESIRVEIFTSSYRIEGNVYLLPQARLSDYMNRPDILSIPVTDVKVFTLDGEEIYRGDFISLNRSQIVFITTPQE